ncbi:MAG: hypothetical protein J5777_03725 [Clostridiales bacterium]|nr:hypothetical protein [Clostridiales bacterium]
MKKITALTLAGTMLCTSLLAGCSYFPAIRLPETESKMTVIATSSNPSESVSETLPAETKITNPAEEADKAYADFLDGKIVLSTSGCFEKDGGKMYLDLGYGSYNFEDLKRALRFDAASGSRIRYALVHCGDNGIHEMAICFANIDGGKASALCLVGYEEGNLVMNALLEQQRADEYRLYDTGYLKSDTTTSEGVNKSVLIRIESGGKCSEVFTYNVYKGATAKAIIRHLSKTEEESSEGYEGLPNDFVVREYISEGKVKFNIDTAKFSTYEYEKKLEEKFIEKIKSLGAEEISIDEMVKLAEAKDYIQKEVTWTTIRSEEEAPSSAAVADVAGRFTLSIYMDPESPDYSALGNVVNVLCSGNGTDMRFVCDSDDVTVIFEKGYWDMNTDSFVKEKELFNIKTKTGTVYQFNCVPQDIFPYYRLRAVKGNYSAEWLVLKNKDNKVTEIKSSMKG